MAEVLQIALGIWLGFLFITGSVWAYTSASKRLERKALRRRMGIA